MLRIIPVMYHACVVVFHIFFLSALFSSVNMNQIKLPNNNNSNNNNNNDNNNNNNVLQFSFVL